MCIPVLQTVLIPFMPGLDSDLANMGVLAYRIIHAGRVTLQWVTPTVYEGAIRVYLLALSFLLFGVNRLSLEMHLGIMNALTILFTYLLIKRAIDARAGLICALILSVCPWFVIRNIHLEFYFVAVSALYLFSRGRNATFLLGGIILGLGCFEHQLIAVVPLSLFITYLALYKTRRVSGPGIACAFMGLIIGFSPRIIHGLISGMRVYREPLNSPSYIARSALSFVPYFSGMLNGTVIYLRNAGAVRFPVIAINSVVFVIAAGILWLRRENILYRALLIFFAALYLTTFLVIKYTAIRYFLPALFAAALIAGLGIYELSLRFAKTAAAVLAIVVCANIFYLFADFFIPFSETGGELTLFRLGSLIEASHHLVRTDILYDCLDKDVGVIITPEPFISRNLEFYDLGKGHLKTISSSMRGGYDRFYFIDYAKSKLGIRIDPARFPLYNVTPDCTGLKNFSVYKFTRKNK